MVKQGSEYKVLAGGDLLQQRLVLCLTILFYMVGGM